MLYTIGYRGFIIWRENERQPFTISRNMRPAETKTADQLRGAQVCSGYRDFAAARRQVDYLESGR